MTHPNPNDPGSDQALSAEAVAQLDRLLSCLCDEVMTADDRRRLNQFLDHSHAARRHYLELIAVHSALVTAAGRFAQPELVNILQNSELFSNENFDERPVPTSVAGSTSLSFRQNRISRRAVPLWGAAAAALCIIGSVVLWTNREHFRQTQTAGIDADHRPAIVSATAHGQLVAKVTYLSPTVRWQEPNASYALASSVRTGQSLSLENGQVELTYASGAKLLLTGPSEFVVESAGGKLRRGELVARVPAEGHGFRIETPHGQVIDLGTEFGIVVDDFGVSQVSCFEGKVEALPLGVADSAQGRIELTSGRGLQLTDKAIIPMDATGSRYQHPEKGTGTSVHTASTVTASIEHDFRSERLPATIGKTIGPVKPTPEGLQLGEATATAEKPYVITRHEFDPSQGAVTVICDVRFADTPNAGDASFAILTRSAQETSKPGSPSPEMLAQFLRCSFRVDPDSGEGILETGTKYEADRELWNISWGGFSRPQPGTLYRLEMRDDGLNVVFTVSLVENPSVRKTIQCRSLFRPNDYFISLEGAIKEKVLIERLQILQERLSDREGSQLAAGGLEGTLQSTDDRAAVAKEFEKLIPANAALLLEDDFDRAELDSRDWTILGNADLVDGQLRLGLANEAGHIDTWKQRPYLLTKKEFDPRDGALTIVGKVTFAENFLNGYGGSFAVMTRANDTRGNGPGWEYSILQRGVRSNFWPAALGFDHSLEIYEKPQSNTISLLTAEGFQINPRSTSYYFRVMDDGKTVALTFIDANNANIHKTISRPTGSTMPAAGHIGFESCWGSPVLLDNIRIFRSEPHARVQPTSNE